MSDSVDQLVSQIKPRQRHYYVRFKAIIGQQQNTIEGGLDIVRSDSISSMLAIEQIAQVINQMIREHQKLPVSCFLAVDVISWQPFEEDLIARIH
jgi:hypothetical protein